MVLLGRLSGRVGRRRIFYQMQSVLTLDPDGRAPSGARPNLFMDVCLLSPHHSGSHAAWASGFAAHSSHSVRLLTMPGQFWKWRMHGAAPHLAAQHSATCSGCDLVLATDLLDFATFLSLQPKTRRARSVAYFHENQLTYPLPSDPSRGPMRRQRGERDLHYAWINYTTLLAVDLAIWNSKFHLDQFFSELPRMLRHFPDMRTGLPCDELLSRCEVLPPGIGTPITRESLSEGSPGGPLILWNHRWEYDKAPEAFFDALVSLRSEGVPFRLAVCGENQRVAPAEFMTGREALADRLDHFGFAEPDIYRELLRRADIVVSTALHDFFGLSIVEAVAHGAFPVLPRRLAYPEILPREHHGPCLYDAAAGLAPKLRWAIGHPSERGRIAKELAASMAGYDWRTLAPRYDALLSRVVEGASWRA